MAKSADSVGIKTGIQQSSLVNSLKDNPSPSINLSMNTSPTLILEQWASSLLSDSQTLQKDLSRFGLKSSQDVITFLKTPAGKSVVKTLSEQAETKRALEQRTLMDNLYQELLAHRIKIAIFLYKLEGRAEAQDRLNEIASELNDKAIAQAKSAGSPKTAAVTSIEKTLAEYDRILNVAQDKQDKTLRNLTKLQQRKTELLFQTAIIRSKYLAYETGLSEIEKFLTKMASLDKNSLEKNIKNFAKDADSRSEKLMSLLDKGKDVTSLKDQVNTINLQIALMHDMINILEGKKYYAKVLQANAIDDPSVVDFKNADYILNKGQRIIEENGALYLLEPGEDLNSIETKTNAKNRFERQKHELMAVKTLVLTNKGEEKKVHDLRINETEANIQTTAAESVLIANQIQLIQAARADALQSLKQIQSTEAASASPSAPPSPSLKPSPVLTPMPSSPRPSSSKKAASTVSTPRLNLNYKQQAAMLLNETQAISMKNFMDIINLVPPNNIGPNVSKALQSLAQRGAPFPQQMMQNILRNLAGLNGTVPTISSIRQQMQYTAEHPEPRANWAPTPFSTNPFKSG